MRQQPPNKQGKVIGPIAILLVILCVNFPIFIVPALAGLIIFWGIYKAKKAAAPPPQNASSHPGFSPQPSYHPQGRAAVPPIHDSARQLPPRQPYVIPKGNFWQSGKDPWDLPPEPDPWER